MDTIGRIVHLIKDKGITEKRFLADLSLNSTTLSDWKSKRIKPSIEHIAKIAAYFGVTTDYLLINEADNPTPPGNENYHLPQAKKNGDEKLVAVLGKILEDEGLIDLDVDITDEQKKQISALVQAFSDMYKTGKQS